MRDFQKITQTNLKSEISTINYLKREVSNTKSHFKRDSKIQDQRSLQYEQSQTLKGKIPNQDNNSKVEFQTTRETPREDLKPREKHKGRTPKPQEETLR